MKVSTAFLIIILSILAPYGVKSEADFCLIDKTYFQIITVVSSSDSSTCHLDEDESWLLSEEEENLKSSNFELPEHPDLSKTKIVTTFKPLDCSEPFADHNDTVEFHFTGRIFSGKIFETSRKPRPGADETLPFKVHLNGQVIVKGWEEGVLGMCEGEKRFVIVPPELGYGTKTSFLGFGDAAVPVGETLYIDIEMIRICKYDPKSETNSPMTSQEFFESLDSNDDNWISKEEYLEFVLETLKQEFNPDTVEITDLRKEGIKITRDIFRHEDLNKDGLISKREFDLIRTGKAREAILFNQK